MGCVVELAEEVAELMARHVRNLCARSKSRTAGSKGEHKKMGSTAPDTCLR